MLIAIEGIDGSGKGTQSARLCEHLQQQGLSAALLSFPRYEQTLFGGAIGEFLNGRFGALEAVHPQLAALLFAGDRFESMQVVREASAKHDVVIFDRYVASNIAHQTAKLDEPERSDLMRWIEKLEYEVYGLPRADLTVLFDLPATAAQRLIAKKAARTYTDQPADLQEADAGYLDQVREVYLALAKSDLHWQRINCMTENTVRSVDDIAAELRSHVDARLEGNAVN